MFIETYLIDLFPDDPDIITENYNFEYADVCGYCELIGWKVNFFRRSKNAPFLAAVSFSEIYSGYEKELGNSILEKMKLKIKFGFDRSTITRLFGKESYIEYAYDDTDRYVYLLDEKIFVSFGFANGRELTDLEMIFDIDMAKDIFEYRKSI